MEWIKVKLNNPGRLEVITVTFFLLAVACMPLYVIRWEYFGIYPTTLLELSIWLTTMAWLLLKARSRKILLPPSFVCTMLSLFLVSSVLGVYFSGDRFSAFGIWRAYIFEPLLLLIIGYDLLKTLGVGMNMLIKKTLVFSILWLAVLGIFQFSFGLFIVTDHQFDRAHGLFNNGNSLALFIGPVISFLTIDLLKKRTKLTVVTVLLLFIALLMTKSFGGLAAYVIAIASYLLIPKFKMEKVASYVFLVFCLAMLVFFSQVHNFAPELDNPWVRPGGTGTVRLCIWEGTWNLLKDNVITGAGISAFQSLYSSDYVTCDAEPLVYPHSILLNFWVEFGILGLFVFVALFAYVFKKRWNLFTVSFVYIFIHGLVDVPYFKNDLSVQFWILILLWLGEYYSVDSSSTGASVSSPSSSDAGA